MSFGIPCLWLTLTGELNQVFSRSVFWSLERFNLATFRRGLLGGRADLRTMSREKIQERNRASQWRGAYADASEILWSLFQPRDILLLFQQ